MATQVERQEHLLNDCLNSLKYWKESIQTYLDGEDKETELKELEEVVKDYCRIDFAASRAAAAQEEVTQRFDDDDDAERTTDIDELYAAKLRECGDTSTESFEQHKFWKEVFLGTRDRDIEEVQETETQTLPTQFEEINDSMYYSNVFTPPVDPISKTVIKDPYKNRVCGHVYEYKFILQYIKSMKNKAKCPYIGCGNKNISVDQLIPDKATKDKIENYLKNHAQNEEPSDDE